MRHRKSFNHLGRKSAHRNAMLANMAASLILHKRIETTTAKAKALRSYVEPLITKSKEDTTHSRRVVFSYLQNKEAVSELFREVAGKVHDRPGGYTRLLKLGTRLGDSAEMCIIELVDFNENMLSEVAAKPKAGRRRRGSKKKEQEKAVVAEETLDVASESPDETVSGPDAESSEQEAAEEKDIDPASDSADNSEAVISAESETPEQQSVAEDQVSDDSSQSDDEAGSADKPEEN